MSFMREVEALRERLSRLSEASLRINESLEFDTVLQGVLDSARPLAGAWRRTVAGSWRIATGPGWGRGSPSPSLWRRGKALRPAAAAARSITIPVAEGERVSHRGRRSQPPFAPLRIKGQAAHPGGGRRPAGPQVHPGRPLEEGYAPIVTGDPGDVPRLMDEEKPHLVLLDLMLPGSNGIELMNLVLKKADVPVIFVSVCAGRALTHDHLPQRAWGMQRMGEPRLVREVVSRLRRKLGDGAQNPRYILTEPRVGYRMAKGEPEEA